MPEISSIKALMFEHWPPIRVGQNGITRIVMSMEYDNKFFVYVGPVVAQCVCATSFIIEYESHSNEGSLS